MGRGGVRYISYAALVLLAASKSSAVDPAIFAVNILEGPAPSPEDGPPLSAHAIRDKALLPYEVIAVVASYVGSVLILGALLLTVGRRLRLRAQNIAAREQEMVKPTSRTFDLSPASPQSNAGWYKLRKAKSATSSIRSGMSNQMSPDVGSVASFDQNVLEFDRQKRLDEMERLYSAVMLQDAAKSRSSLVAAAEVPTAPPSYDARRPPQIITTDPRLRHLHEGPASPRSPIRAIYPPDAAIPATPMSPTSPIRAEYPVPPLSSNPPYPIDVYPGELRTPRAGRTLSVGSAKSGKLRKGLRNLKISAPLQADDNSDGARTPLSPRFYTDPGIPPEPPTPKTMESDVYPSATPVTAGTTRSWRYRRDGVVEEEQMDEVRELPQPHPNRLSTYNNTVQPPAMPDATPTRREPTKPSLKPVGSVDTTLPFRQLSDDQRRAAHPLSPGVWQQQLSAGPVKTTFLEARRKPYAGMHSATAPRTGMATPYSPYMPFTPLTPVTPHLTSRAERKQRRKEDKALRGVITEEEQVVDDKDMWSSGY